MKEDDFIHNVIGAIKEVLPETDRAVGLHEPCFSGKEQTYLKECIDSTWVSYLGKFVEQFERSLG